MNKKPVSITANVFVTEKNYRVTKDYEIISKIGIGAFSETFKAKHKITKQFRCIKKIKKKKLKKEEQEKLIEEVMILKDLDHPNIGKLLTRKSKFTSFTKMKSIYSLLWSIWMEENCLTKYQI